MDEVAPEEADEIHYRIVSTTLRELRPLLCWRWGIKAENQFVDRFEANAFTMKAISRDG